MVNLLPPEIKNRYRVASRLYLITLCYFMLIVVMALSIAGLFTYNYRTQISLQNNQAELESLVSQRQREAEITTKAAFIEDRLKANAQYQEKVEWEDILAKLASATPTNVQLTNIQTDISAGTVNLDGVTGDRRAIILFRDRLTQDKIFPGAEIKSIAEVAEETGKKFTFSLSLEVKPDAL
mgnify:CR=1 FL=1